MTPPIPTHLTDQPTWRGLVVPRVNAWGAEARTEGLTIHPDPVVGNADALFSAGREAELLQLTAGVSDQWETA